jgi:2-succinyl-5-enolpyruvyl-6-hydroxy-3-cyclohexene-1-carboxylate synthase
VAEVWWDGGVREPAVTQATFCATLVDEWARAGVRHAFAAPGSRSTPMAMALAADDRIELQVHHDERCTAFLALGVGVATRVPAIALCTSGTAATHFHAAVVEAHHARVPLLVLTADRPPELRDVGAPQTIDQAHLYGRAVRWFHDPGPADEAGRHTWRSIAARAVLDAATGPVHLNLPFREPLVGDAGTLPPARPDGRPWTTATTPTTAGSPLAVRGRSLLVAGGGAHVDGGVAPLPVLASPMADTSAAAAPVIAHADALLRVPGLATELRPEVVVQVGTLASRVVNEWVAASGAEHLMVGDRWLDPAHTVAAMGNTIGEVVPPPAGWLDRWLALDAAAGDAIAAVLADHPEPTEPGTARALLADLPAGAHLVVSSSMPVRDLEWYARPRPDVTVHANRGANGIDGVLSTATGAALATGAPTACLLGDVAFLHDSNALIGIARRGVDLTVVVVDNDGGGIFSFLPQASRLPADRFEQLFGTPHGVRPEHLAAAHGLLSITVESADALPTALGAARAGGGVHVVVVRTDRAANVKLHEELHSAVAEAVTR